MCTLKWLLWSMWGCIYVSNPNPENVEFNLEFMVRYHNIALCRYSFLQSGGTTPHHTHTLILGCRCVCVIQQDGRRASCWMCQCAWQRGSSAWVCVHYAWGPSCRAERGGPPPSLPCRAGRPPPRPTSPQLLTTPDKRGSHEVLSWAWFDVNMQHSDGPTVATHAHTVLYSIWTSKYISWKNKWQQYISDVRCK